MTQQCLYDVKIDTQIVYLICVASVLKYPTPITVHTFVDVDDFTSFKRIMITHIANAIKGGSTAIMVVDEWRVVDTMIRL